MVVLSHPELRGSVVSASRHLFAAGVMSHSGHGNFSARVDDGTFLLTTTGMVRDLGEDQLALVDLGGDVIEGALSAENAEIVAMHSALYRLRPGVGGIIHTHSPGATAFALANKALACRHEPLLRFGQAEEIQVVPWGPRGSDVSVRGIERALSGQKATKAVLLGNHGLLAFSTDPLSTAHLVVAIEESAEAELAAASLGGAHDLPAGALQSIRESMARGGG